MLLLTQNLTGGGGGYSPPDLSWDFNNGVNGVKVDIADTPSAGDDAFASVTENTASGGHFKYSSVAPAHGPLGLRVETGVTSVSTYAQWDITGSGLAVYFRTALYIPTGSTFAARLDFWQYRDASTRTRFGWDTSRRLQLINGSTVVGTMTAAIPFDTTVRVEGRMVIDAAAGVLEVKLFTGDSETPTETLTVTGLNTGTVECTNVRMGSPFAVASLGPIYFDDFGISYAGYMGPAVTAASGGHADPTVVRQTLPPLEALAGSSTVVRPRDGAAAVVVDDVPSPLVVPSTRPPAASPLVVVSRPVTDPPAPEAAPARPVVVAGSVAPPASGSVATVRRGPAPVEVAARPTIAAALLPPPAVPVVLIPRPGADPVVVAVDAPVPLVVTAGPPPSSVATALVVRTLVDALAAPTVPARPVVVTAGPVPPATSAPSSSRALVDPAAVVVDGAVRPVVVTGPEVPPRTPSVLVSRTPAPPAFAAPRPVVAAAVLPIPAAGSSTVSRSAVDPVVAAPDAPARPTVVSALLPPPVAGSSTIARPVVDPVVVAPVVPPRPTIATSSGPAPAAGSSSVARPPAAAVVDVVPPRPVVVSSVAVPLAPSTGTVSVVRPVATELAVPPRPTVTTSTVKPPEVAAVIAPRPATPFVPVLRRPAPLVLTHVTAPPPPAGWALVARTYYVDLTATTPGRQGEYLFGVARQGEAVVGTARQLEAAVATARQADTRVDVARQAAADVPTARQEA